MRIALDGCLGILFAIAALGILGWHLQPLDGLGVALALTFLCIEQGRMALVDLNNIHQVTNDCPTDGRVRPFYRVTIITIALELIGFYLAWYQLGLGTGFVLLSQVFFNTAAKIQLYPGSLEPIQPMGVKERSPVLLIDALAFGVIALWQIGQFRQAMSALLLVMVLTYLAVKYLTTSTAAVANGGESP